MDRLAWRRSRRRCEGPSAVLRRSVRNCRSESWRENGSPMRATMQGQPPKTTSIGGSDSGRKVGRRLSRIPICLARSKISFKRLRILVIPRVIPEVSSISTSDFTNHVSFSSLNSQSSPQLIGFLKSKPRAGRCRKRLINWTKRIVREKWFVFFVMRRPTEGLKLPESLRQCNSYPDSSPRRRSASGRLMPDSGAKYFTQKRQS